LVEEEIEEKNMGGFFYLPFKSDGDGVLDCFGGIESEDATSRKMANIYLLYSPRWSVLSTSKLGWTRAAMRV